MFRYFFLLVLNLRILKPPKAQCVKISDKYIYMNGLSYVQKIV